jgi:hypothetical protein
MATRPSLEVGTAAKSWCASRRARGAREKVDPGVALERGRRE